MGAAAPPAPAPSCGRSSGNATPAAAAAAARPGIPSTGAVAGAGTAAEAAAAAAPGAAVGAASRVIPESPREMNLSEALQFVTEWIAVVRAAAKGDTCNAAATNRPQTAAPKQQPSELSP